MANSRGPSHELQTLIVEWFVEGLDLRKTWVRGLLIVAASGARIIPENRFLRANPQLKIAQCVLKLTVYTSKSLTGIALLEIKSELELKTNRKLLRYALFLNYCTEKIVLFRAILICIKIEEKT